MGEKQQTSFIFICLFLFLYGQGVTCQTAQKHFVLVHGAGHGGWCWYKLQPLLEAAGHNVTVFDLTASGIDLTSIFELSTFDEYNQPLYDVLESIPQGEKVVLVGHSLGGMNIAFAMEKYPKKISVAVFVAALMPDTVHEPTYILDKFATLIPSDFYLDTVQVTSNNRTAGLFGPQYLSRRLYQLSPPENVALAISLGRPSSGFNEDLANKNAFTNEGYGSVERAFIHTIQDGAQIPEFQFWELQNNPVSPSLYKEIDSDHMVMISRPLELCIKLLEIANQVDLKNSL